jgi:hypothetical protein
VDVARGAAGRFARGQLKPHFRRLLLVTNTGEPYSVNEVGELGKCFRPSFPRSRQPRISWLAEVISPTSHTRGGQCSAGPIHKLMMICSGLISKPWRQNATLFVFTSQPTGYHDRVGVHRDSKDYCAERRQRIQNENF